MIVKIWQCLHTMVVAKNLNVPGGLSGAIIASMSIFMETVVGEDAIAKISSIVRSYPEGIMVEQIKEWFGFDTNVTRAALRILQERGEVQETDPLRKLIL